MYRRNNGEGLGGTFKNVAVALLDDRPHDWPAASKSLCFLRDGEVFFPASRGGSDNVVCKP